MSAGEAKQRQSNPFLPNYEPDPAMDQQIREALNSPEGQKMLQDLSNEIDKMILSELRRALAAKIVKESLS